MRNVTSWSADEKYFFLQPLEILRPLMIPIAGAGRTRRVHGADAGIEQRFHRGIGMGGAAGIVGIVDHAGDAGIDAAHGGEIIADIVILRPIEFGEGQMRCVHIVRKRRRIRIDAAQLSLPRNADGNRPGPAR